MDKVQLSNEIEIAYRDVGQGIPIVLIHGLDGNLAAFKQLFEQLSDRYRVITYDVRGHGKSSRCEVYDLEDHIEDLYMLMDQLDISSAHILGHDMGGLIGKRFTEKYPFKTISLTAISSKREDIAHGFTQLMVDHQDLVAGFNKSEALLLLFPFLFKEQDNTMKWFQDQRMYSRPSAEESAIAIRALISSNAEEQEATQLVNVPTLIINGFYDPLIKDKINYCVDDHFENITKMIFNESGHAPHIEEPEKFINVYLDFISSIEHWISK
ncbi:alpha/beta hydrolase [Staphylococcus pasteuri]|uniref:alpha/beta fold hydrolase n=1 Tax=Staphylococcus pasteuri TaxID=45972 RepID=UPI0011890A89|nr:alpha/beta hydrolase [Staphylococcus pasteuri]QDW85312.1 alpha/beta hydrolase [Staphylococcus pasteuri]